MRPHRGGSIESPRAPSTRRAARASFHATHVRLATARTQETVAQGSRGPIWVSGAENLILCALFGDFHGEPKIMAKIANFQNLGRSFFGHKTVTKRSFWILGFGGYWVPEAAEKPEFDEMRIRPHVWPKLTQNFSVAPLAWWNAPETPIFGFSVTKRSQNGRKTVISGFWEVWGSQRGVGEARNG